MYWVNQVAYRMINGHNNEIGKVEESQHVFYWINNDSIFSKILTLGNNKSLVGTQQVSL